MGSHNRHTRWGKVAAPLLMATHLAACTSWRVETVPVTQLLQTRPPSDLRVTRADRSTVVLHTPGVVRDSLWGWSRGAELGIPLIDVRALALARRQPLLSRSATALAVFCCLDTEQAKGRREEQLKAVQQRVTRLLVAYRNREDK
jgi:hypothetical protein